MRSFEEITEWLNENLHKYTSIDVSNFAKFFNALLVPGETTENLRTSCYDECNDFFDDNTNAFLDAFFAWYAPSHNDTQDNNNNEYQSDSPIKRSPPPESHNESHYHNDYSDHHRYDERPERPIDRPTNHRTIVTKRGKANAQAHLDRVYEATRNQPRDLRDGPPPRDLRDSFSSQQHGSRHDTRYYRDRSPYDDYQYRDRDNRDYYQDNYSRGDKGRYMYDDDSYSRHDRNGNKDRDASRDRYRDRDSDKLEQRPYQDDRKPNLPPPIDLSKPNTKPSSHMKSSNFPPQGVMPGYPPYGVPPYAPGQSTKQFSKDSIFLRNVPSDLFNETAIEKLFTKFCSTGTLKVVMRPPKNCIVNFTSEDDAAEAMKNPPSIPDMKVDWKTQPSAHMSQMPYMPYMPYMMPPYHNPYYSKEKKTYKKDKNSDETSEKADDTIEKKTPQLTGNAALSLEDSQNIQKQNKEKIISQLKKHVLNLNKQYKSKVDEEGNPLSEEKLKELKTNIEKSIKQIKSLQ